MSYLRHILFALFFAAWTVFICALTMPLLLVRGNFIHVRVGQIWGAGSLWLLKILAGISYEVHGREHIPEGPFLIASKHQSAWETIAFWVIFRKPCFILKRELLMIPFFGWHLWGLRMIAINRAGGTKTLKAMTADAQERMSKGWRVVIFPEGTRVAHNATETRYQSGVSLLYQALKVPVLPVALNSGKFWPKTGAQKFSGTVQVRLLPCIAPGLSSKEFLPTLEQSIEAAQATL